MTPSASLEQLRRTLEASDHGPATIDVLLAGYRSQLIGQGAIALGQDATAPFRDDEGKVSGRDGVEREAAARQVFIEQLARGAGEPVATLAFRQQGDTEADFGLGDGAHEGYAGMCVHPGDHDGVGLWPHQF